jgi:hypothetical protein
VLITFDVQEGPQVTVNDLHMVGNVEIPAADQSRRHGEIRSSRSSRLRSLPFRTLKTICPLVGLINLVGRMPIVSRPFNASLSMHCCGKKRRSANI